jgi:catechol 2,3-dioxygenase-like lactoylglutathione lyase family enzyme
MKQRIGCVSLLVRDYDEAIAFYTKRLGFELIEDTPLEKGKRWVLVAPSGSSECRILLAKATTKEEIGGIGRQSGGRVFLFLHTDDFWRDFRAFSLRGVQFCESPRQEPYGLVAVFVDICGNRWDLLELKTLKPSPGDGHPAPIFDRASSLDPSP